MEAQEKEEEKVFSTRDLYLASALVTLKFPLIRIDMQIEGIKPKAIGYFNFIETQNLRDARSQYNQGMILVEPRMYINNLQSLKAEVVNMQQNPNSSYNNG
ncbi:MAG: hypothetical protein WC917_02035 [Bacilli bacterium]|jgi:hypothetical protein